MLEQITAGMPGGFFIYHAGGSEKLIYANQALVRIFGCRDLEDFQQYTGYTFRGLVCPEDWERISNSIRQQIAKRRDHLDYVEYRIRRKDGHIRWIEDYGHFVHTERYGDIFYVFVEDVTDRNMKRLADERSAWLSQERLAALQSVERETTTLHMVHELLNSGMWSMEFDPQGQMTSVSWSSEFRAMLGYEDETDFPNVLESWSDLLHPEDREEVLRKYYHTIADYTGQQVFDAEYRLLTRHQGYRWFRAKGKLSRRPDGTPITYAGIFVDVTRQRQAEEELDTQHRLLAEALDQAQKANQAKTAFLNNMSHDIRTPMNAIIGFTNLASSHIDNPSMVKSYLSKIQAASSHLLCLINDVLDMSRIESGKTQIEAAPCSLHDIFQDLQDIIQTDALAKDLTFSIDTSAVTDMAVVCDRLRLRQVLLNIVSNAVKFTPSRGTVQVRAVQLPEAGEGWGSYVFTIRDTGIGMSPAFLEHIFEPFERERSSTVSGIQGTGLGMAITKSIVDMMGGSIQVESEIDQGSTFTISLRLPLSSQPLQTVEQQTTVQSVASHQGKRILLAEDNELNQEIAVTILEEAGFTVAVAGNGAEAVERVKASAENPYDLILMDLQMPVLDGFGATRAIRELADPRLSSLPILAMTANAFEEDRQRVLEAGMNGHLGKPIEIDKLMAALDEVLGSQPDS
ncbi:MAG: PAS domain-containing protein [Oscillospiraceae bacterium]|nr:PAS domain-containing protein [Oscillospiraceae bacterium]